MATVRHIAEDAAGLSLECGYTASVIDEALRALPECLPRPAGLGLLRSAMSAGMHPVGFAESVAMVTAPDYLT
jgi:hypothetical protein